MTAIIILITILIITGLTYVVNRLAIIKKQICPICAGVSLTWLISLILNYTTNYQVEPLILGMLMGGSVVGFSYTFDYRVTKSLLGWRIFSVLGGFAAVYSLLAKEWIVFGLSALVWLFSVWFFLRKKPDQATTDNTKVEELEKEMKKCC
ncbi:MAG: hypothetical protein HY395_02465 [Candidatus Doudnabacteria bacterium]|nr:hypothetical protein [Candidatus Doudnabacteria bacterium]